MFLDINSVYSLFSQCSCVTTDSRNCPANSLFIALKGASFNGNAFAVDSLRKGCKFAIVDEEAFADGKQIFLVQNCLQTLQLLAQTHRRKLGTQVIGITGTNGKTTSKELIAAVLQKKYNILYTQGNLNNSIGVPLTVLGLNPEHELAVVEMGASHPGDIKELVNVCEPDFGLITNVGRAHLQGFGSFEGVIHTKGELYDFIRAHGGLVFRNADNSHLASIAANLKSVLYGTDASNFVSGTLLPTAPFLSVQWAGHTIHTHLVGDYNLENVLAAICVGTYFKVPEADVVDALQTYMPSNNRSQFKKTATNQLFIDAYNANPTSMKASLLNFFKLDMPHKVLILGDMKELGPDSQSLHQSIVDLIAQNNVDKVFLVGSCFAQVATPSMQVFANVDELIQQIQSQPISHASVLVKGSNSTHLIKVIDSL